MHHGVERVEAFAAPIEGKEAGTRGIPDEAGTRGIPDGYRHQTTAEGSCV